MKLFLSVDRESVKSKIEILLDILIVLGILSIGLWVLQIANTFKNVKHVISQSFEKFDIVLLFFTKVKAAFCVCFSLLLLHRNFEWKQYLVVIDWHNIKLIFSRYLVKNKVEVRKVIYHVEFIRSRYETSANIVFRPITSSEVITRSILE